MRARLFPAPSVIGRQFLDMLQEGGIIASPLLHHLLVSLYRLFLAVLIGTAAGVVVGVTTGFKPTLEAFTRPFISFFLPIPGIALAPLFLILLGFGNPTILTTGALAAFFPVAFNTTYGIRTVNNTLIHAAEIMGATKWQVLRHVYLPWSAIHIFTGFKLGVSRCWRTVIAVELIAAADWGLGYMVMESVEYLQMSTVYVGIILMACVFLVIEKGLIGFFENRTIHKWGIMEGRN